MVNILFAAKPAEVVHVVDMASWPLAYTARLRARNTHIVLSAHGTDVSYADRRGLKGICYKYFLHLGALLLNNSVVIANSHCTAAAVKRRGFQNVQVVPLATDMTYRSENHRTKQHILFAGRLIPLKGCAWFIRKVLPLLPETITLHVAGTIVDKDEEKALQNRRVRYLGALSQPELAPQYAKAMCVIVPNILLPTKAFEGFGLVALEAAACGGVVVAARCGGLPDAVINNVTGFTITSGAADQWANKIMEIDGWSEKQREIFISNIQPIITSRYSWKRVADETVRHYSSD